MQWTLPATMQTLIDRLEVQHSSTLPRGVNSVGPMKQGQTNKKGTHVK